MKLTRLGLTFLILMLSMLLAACGGGAPAPAPSGGDSTDSGSGDSGSDAGSDASSDDGDTDEDTSDAGGESDEEAGGDSDEGAGGAGIDTADKRGKLYLGTILPPASGPTAVYLHEDSTIDFVMITTDQVERSYYMAGELVSLRIDVAQEVGTVRANGRLEGDDVELNITIPGSGFFRTNLEASEEGGLYLGELNGLTAAAIVQADGTFDGLAAVEGGDEPTWEFLCLTEELEGLPEEISAVTCDTEQPIVLSLVTN
ncbi:MAG: hypothetical protein GYB68_13210 [Chloroflexi bacterium]|nr:hypothetical protein [Chloroflexota bacterium]